MSEAIATLRTPRLILRPLVLQDAGPVQRIFPRWEIVRYMADRIPWPYPADGALRFIGDVALPAMHVGSAWHWSIRAARLPDEMLGLISVTDEPDNNRGFWLVPEYWRQGLATEAVQAVTDFWFRTLERPLLRVWKADVNAASRRLSERDGMRMIAAAERGYVAGRLASHLWELSREEWQSRSASRIA